MSPILLLGAGGHCRSCIDVIEAGGVHRIVGIVEQAAPVDASPLNYPIVGSDADLPALLEQVSFAFVAVGQIKSSATRSRLYALLSDLGARLPVIKSPFSYCSPRSELGAGTIVMHGAVVNANATVAENCIINSQALVEHDCCVGPHCHISTGARVNGGVSIGPGCFIGSGAILKEGIVVGAHAVIGAGQVVMRNVGERDMLRGSP